MRPRIDRRITRQSRDNHATITRERYRFSTGRGVDFVGLPGRRNRRKGARRGGAEGRIAGAVCDRDENARVPGGAEGKGKVAVERRIAGAVCDRDENARVPGGAEGKGKVAVERRIAGAVCDRDENARVPGGAGGVAEGAGKGGGRRAGRGGKSGGGAKRCIGVLRMCVFFCTFARYYEFGLSVDIAGACRRSVCFVAGCGS